MKLNVQRRLAACVLKCSPERVWFDPERLDDVKEAITKIDMRNLVKDNAVKGKPVNSTSRGRARKRQAQKRAGRRRGHGSRKGRAGARINPKGVWINSIRALRGLLIRMKQNGQITTDVYGDLYAKAKGGFFRSKKHLKLYIEERGLLKAK